MLPECRNVWSCLPLAAFHKIAKLAHPDLHRNGLTPEELEAVREYEQAHRGRATILGKILQLSG